MSKRAPKNKPMEDNDARDLFDNSSEKLDMCADDNYDNCLESFMDRLGYRWSHVEQMYVDNGDVASDWADRENDRAKDMASEQANKDKAE